MTAIVQMAYFPFLALPPELRVMVYAYFLPTNDHENPFRLLRKRPFVSLRQTCQVVKQEIDYEALRLSCLLVLRENPDYALSVSVLDMQQLKMVIRNKAAQPIRDFDSLNLSWWEELRASRVDIVYEPCGQRDTDIAAFTSICQCIAQKFSSHYVRLPSSFYVRLQKAGEEPAWCETNWFLSIFRLPRVAPEYMSTTAQYYDMDGLLIACEWHDTSSSGEIPMILFYLGLLLFYLAASLCMVFVVACLVYNAVISMLTPLAVKFTNLLSR